MNKKLIEFGWNYPTVTFLLNNMSSLSRRPFQGLVFKPFWPEYSPGFPQNILYPFTISESYMQLNTLATINWAKTLTDNFMHVWVAGFSYADWFNDSQWAVVDTNLRRMSKAVAYANAKGLFFDTEHYGGNIWRYNSTLYPSHTLEQVQAKVRQRGYEFMQALSSYKTDIRILATGLWMFPNWEAGGNVNAIQNSGYCLLKSFADGMLDAASGQVKLIDGNEISYYWLNTVNWHYPPGVYDLVSGARGFIDPSLLNKNDTFKQVGQSIYYEKFKPVSNPVKQKKLEHNVYNSLLMSDEYVWFYSEESASWWTSPFPIEADSAIRSGYNKFMRGQPLGFTISNDSVVHYSTDLQIISPAQNQAFNVGDTIEVRIQSAPSVNNINYYTSHRKVPNISNPPASYKALAVYPGTYLVYAYSNGSLKLSNPVTYHVSGISAGIGRIEERNGLVVYPNPILSSATIQFPHSVMDAEMHIVDVLGRTIRQVGNISGPSVTLHRDNLPSGLYFVRLTEGNKELSRTMIIVID